MLKRIFFIAMGTITAFLGGVFKCQIYIDQGALAYAEGVITLALVGGALFGQPNSTLRWVME